MHTRVAGIGCVLAVVGSLVLAGPASSATGAAVVTRYASPNGTTSATCPKSLPCDIVNAIEGAPAHSHVILLPGTYSVTGTLTDTNPDLLISGLAGKSRPVLDATAGGPGAILISNGSRLTGLTIDYTGPSNGILVSEGSADHMIVNASSNAERACIVDTSLTDSLCTNTAPGGTALAALVLGATPTYRNVTAIATGTGMYADGLLLDGSGSTNSVTATNSIFQGTDEDVRIYPEDNGEVDTVTLHNCDVSRTFFANLGAGISTEAINVDNTDIKAAPRFALGTYQEAAGSPTINRGAAVAGSDTDLAGEPRLLGAKTDIGAYEFKQTATASRLKLSQKKPTSARVTASINPEGLATKAHLVATHGLIAISSPMVSAGKGRAAKTLSFALRLLSPGTKYSIRVVTVNAGGTATSAAKSYRTPRH